MRVVVTNDGSRTLFCDQTKQTYHSESGAWSESIHVFIRNSGIQDLFKSQKSARFLEIGLGTGLNFLLTADLANAQGSFLNYTALDTRIPSTELVNELGYEAFVPSKLINAWYQWLEQRVDNDSSSTASPFSDNLKLRFIEGDASSEDSQVRWAKENWYDVIYLDAFSPEACPELWTEKFFGRLYRTLVAGGVMTTYCVKSEIQKRLRQIGFQVERIPGPEGGKREVLRAVRI